ncbi:MAG: ATP-dependent helicase [Pirellula sp.]|jgi:DNA helicase-2/ATP-dependent DNA helicase PcrA
MAELNPPQQHAVDTLSGPLLVLAGAGTGKTRVVTFRIANLIRHGTRADRILAVTFTNKASHEMHERISHQLKIPKRVRRGQPSPPRPAIGTFHSHCVQILKRHSKALGYPEKFTIYDRSDAESVARTILREIKVHEAMLSPSEFLNIVSGWKNLGVRPEESMSVAKDDKEHMAASGYWRYQRALKLQAAFDFDDLLVCAEQLLHENETIRKEEAGRYDHVLVDEYQDTNGSQYRIIKALAIDHRNLCVVGDDDQSIYGWRGAEVRHILNFKSDWPEATMVRLEDNYRSTEAILEMANLLIAFNSHRHEKTLRAARRNGQQPRILQFPTEGDEAKGVVEEIAIRLKNDPTVEAGDFAILFRTNEQPRPFEMQLRALKLPYVITGSQSFFDRKEVRDLLAYFRWLETPEDELALLRVINVPPRGMGATSIEKLLKKAVADSSNIWTVMHDKKIVGSLPSAAQAGIAKLRELHAEFSKRAKALVGPDATNAEETTSDSETSKGNDSLTKLVSDVIQMLKYRAEVERLYPDVDECQMRLSSIEEVINAVAEFEEEAEVPAMHDFLSNVTLAGREFGSPKEKEMKKNAISLMTYHSAKGLEFPIVYMVGMEEGILPHRRSIIGNAEEVDEERRLCYVGVTRAQDELTLTLPMSRYKWGKPRPTYPSRFLYEVTGQADNPNRLKSIRAAAEAARKAEAQKR